MLLNEIFDFACIDAADENLYNRYVKNTSAFDAHMQRSAPMKSYANIFIALSLTLLMIFIFASCESETVISKIPEITQSTIETVQNEAVQKQLETPERPEEPTEEPNTEAVEEETVTEEQEAEAATIAEETAEAVPEDPTVTETDEPYDAVADIKTIGDAMAQRDGDVEQIATYNDMVVYVFQKDGTYYRAMATATPEKMAAVNALSAADASYEDNFSALVSDISIDRIENLSAAMPDQKQLDALVGKTGKDLFNDGWYPVGYNLSAMRVTVRNGMFDYHVIFEKNSDDEVPEKVNATEYFGELPIKTITCIGIGDATDLGTIAW